MYFKVKDLSINTFYKDHFFHLHKYKFRENKVFYLHDFFYLNQNNY